MHLNIKLEIFKIKLIYLKILSNNLEDRSYT